MFLHFQIKVIIIYKNKKAPSSRENGAFLYTIEYLTPFSLKVYYRQAQEVIYFFSSQMIFFSLFNKSTFYWIKVYYETKLPLKFKIKTKSKKKSKIFNSKPFYIQCFYLLL